MLDMFIDRYPKIDLHGYDRDSARLLVNDFIADNIILGNEIIVIIHGIGKGILKKEVEETLKKNKYVENYKIHNFNEGCTIVKLIKKDMLKQK